MLSIFYPVILPDSTPMCKEFRGVTDFTYVNGYIEFSYYDKNGESKLKVDLSKILYFTFTP